jgi:hypothetical protein
MKCNLYFPLINVNRNDSKVYNHAIGGDLAGSQIDICFFGKSTWQGKWGWNPKEVNVTKKVKQSVGCFTL